MKTLYIIRHGKSSWDFPNLPDYERPLINRGINKTNKVVGELKASNISVDMIISSHAKRALETAKIIATGICFPVEKIIVDKSIYHSDCELLTEMLQLTDNSYNKVMIVGHNPTLTQLSNLFLSKKIECLPTSGTVCITFDTDDWADFLKAKFKQEFIIFPKIDIHE